MSQALRVRFGGQPQRAGAGVTRLLAVVVLAVSVVLPAAAQNSRAPDGFADLAERVMDSVVNIKASQRVAQRNVPA
ncbi:MAG: hypothetical protein ACOVLI_01785, partial [Rhabdaerophilum sp.]